MSSGVSRCSAEVIRQCSRGSTLPTAATGGRALCGPGFHAPLLSTFRTTQLFSTVLLSKCSPCFWRRPRLVAFPFHGNRPWRRNTWHPCHRFLDGVIILLDDGVIILLDSVIKNDDDICSFSHAQTLFTELVKALIDGAAKKGLMMPLSPCYTYTGDCANRYIHRTQTQTYSYVEHKYIHIWNTNTHTFGTQIHAHLMKYKYIRNHGHPFDKDCNLCIIQKILSKLYAECTTPPMVMTLWA